MPLEQPKLYILVRRDLSVPQQVVQACHALASLSFRAASSPINHIYFQWVREDGPLAILGVKDLGELLEYKQLLEDSGIAFEIFIESSMEDEPTALAVMPGADDWLFRKLNLL